MRAGGGPCPIMITIYYPSRLHAFKYHDASRGRGRGGTCGRSEANLRGRSKHGIARVRGVRFPRGRAGGGREGKGRAREVEGQKKV